MTRARKAEVVREYGPFEGVKNVGGVSFDGHDVWMATGDRMQSFDPETGAPGRALGVVADAGTAFDGERLYQLGEGVIQTIDPHTGAVLARIPSPAAKQSAGLTWAEGTLWVAHHRERKILQVDPKTGHVLRTLDAARFVTGITFVDGDLWHGTYEESVSDLRRVDARTGEVLEILEMPEGKMVSGLESNGADIFYCGGGGSGKVRAVRRPR